jgi:DNA-binding NtrC family response regulator
LSATAFSGETTLAFAVLGPSFFLFLDNRPVLRFFDKDCRFFGKGRVSIGFRKGAKALLLSAFVKVRNRARAGGEEGPVKHIVRLKARPEHNYVLEGYHTPSQTVPQFEDLDRYLLYNVTDFQGAIKRLDESYRREIKRGQKLQKLVNLYREGDHAIVGTGTAMAAVKATALTAAKTNATVLIEGETGTGKEVLAQFVHANSPRRDKPFVKVDCATVPSTLIESHLFGYEKGAFTGALARTEGMFEKAQGGTLFLDEAANLPVTTQAKLLQFFNDFTVTRLGGTEPVKLEVRCIVASNRNLEALVREGVFREDLFYRLSVIRIRMPLLRERLDDVPELALHFLETCAELHNKRVEGFSPEALRKLQDHSWQGNVRELKNTVENAVIFSEGRTITPEFIHFPERTAAGGAVRKRKRQPFRLKLTDPGVIKDLLARHYGSVSKAAKELGVSKVSLYSYIRTHALNPAEFQKGFGGNAGSKV